MTPDNNDLYFPSKNKPKIAVVLLQMGGPYSQELVKPFLINLFSDKDIIRLPPFLRPLQGFIARMITLKRLSFVKDNYKLIGGGSPIFQHTSGLTKEVYQELTKRGLEDIDVTFVMRYSEPRAEEIAEMIKNRNVSKVLLFPLYPHYSQSTTGSSVNDFLKSYSKRSDSKIVEIGDWSTEPFYINWWVEKIRTELESLKSSPKETKIVFSVHGLPKRYIDNGDPYYDSVKSAVKSIMRNFPDNEYVLAFQSKVGPIEWLRPYTVDAIDDIAGYGKARDLNLVFVPLGFVSDHIETLQEVDILYTDQAKDLGVETIKRTPVPNASEQFAKDVTNFIVPYLEV